MKHHWANERFDGRCWQQRDVLTSNTPMTRCTDKRQQNYADIGFQIPHSGAEAPVPQSQELVVFWRSRFGYGSWRYFVCRRLSSEILIAIKSTSDLECRHFKSLSSHQTFSIQFYRKQLFTFACQKPPTIILKRFTLFILRKGKQNQTNNDDNNKKTCK